MKKIIVSILILSIICSVSGCKGNRIELDENAGAYSFEKSTEFDCMELKYNGHTYRPFVAAEPSQADKAIGYYIDNQGEMEYVFSLKGQSTEEWIVDVMKTDEESVNGHTIGFVWKEISVKEIPEGMEVEPEYAKWN